MFFLVTAQGRAKPLVFGPRRHDPPWSDFKDKVVYSAVTGSTNPLLAKARSPTTWESHLQNSMTSLVKTRVYNTIRPPLVIFSTVDELPSPQTLFVLKTCTFPVPLHLQLHQYLYSLEFPYGWGSWRAQIHEWKADTAWTRDMSSNDMLVDSGWHCKGCWRQLKDYIQGKFGLLSLSACLTTHLISNSPGISLEQGHANCAL